MVVVMLVLILDTVQDHLVDPVVVEEDMDHLYLVVLQQVMELVTVVELVRLVATANRLVVVAAVPVLVDNQVILVLQLGLMVVMVYNILNLKVV